MNFISALLSGLRASNATILDGGELEENVRVGIVTLCTESRRLSSFNEVIRISQDTAAPRTSCGRSSIMPAGWCETLDMGDALRSGCSIRVVGLGMVGWRNFLIEAGSLILTFRVQ
jgi:hypothetical protein